MYKMCVYDETCVKLNNVHFICKSYVTNLSFSQINYRVKVKTYVFINKYLSFNYYNVKYYGCSTKETKW